MFKIFGDGGFTCVPELTSYISNEDFLYYGFKDLRKMHEDLSVSMPNKTIRSLALNSTRFDLSKARFSQLSEAPQVSRHLNLVFDYEGDNCICTATIIHSPPTWTIQFVANISAQSIKLFCDALQDFIKTFEPLSSYSGAPITSILVNSLATIFRAEAVEEDGPVNQDVMQQNIVKLLQIWTRKLHAAIELSAVPASEPSNAPG